MSKEIQPTSLLLFVVLLLVVVGKYVYDKGTSAPPATGGQGT